MAVAYEQFIYRCHACDKKYRLHYDGEQVKSVKVEKEEVHPL
jgi:hypothetical protein